MLYILTDTININQLIISGDFNYDVSRDVTSRKGLLKTSAQWLTYLDSLFYNSTIHNSMHTLPTFQRQIGTTSTIDCIYLGLTLKNNIKDASIQYIQSKWSDHALLQLQLNVDGLPSCKLKLID
ncbi:uncharacterized protein EV154DRAFT_514448 [Mucor mucedo]|uniref:uncharacterized protein n=1 Tax=Mucor mucedo TaxID=29922 RepID=UPI00221F1FEB|nr:uncharacterized protein EV154DRAFT_514448 [Mucor mucedo]KAI7889500.1 hypothetical protein EV154DRAFT_514448 [Mucor mucedo]